jgi:hypothetical protein
VSRNRRSAFAIGICVVLGLTFFGTIASAKPKQFAQAKALASYLQRHTKTGCDFAGYIVEPGKAVHPADEGKTAAEFGIGHDAFEMNNRIIEWAGCSLKGTQTSLSISRFAGTGLPLTKYRRWLQTSILPEACQLAKPSDTIVEAIWASGGALWNAEPSSIEFEDVPPLPVTQREELLHEVTAIVGGYVVAVSC